MNVKKPLVIIFDVNETLLDLSPLKMRVNDLLKTGDGFRIWFGMLLHYSLVDNSINVYHDFAALAHATLGMAAASLSVNINENEKAEALKTIKTLPAHPDVEQGLSMLKHNGYRLATLTNSPPVTLAAQMQHTKLIHYFEATLSIDFIKRYKPAFETYLWAAGQLSVNRDETLMVAAHGWDIAGAMQAGMQAGFIERNGQTLFPLVARPQFSGKNLVELAKSIIEYYN